ncbi:MAG: response regulator [Thermodesulfobacteriota bacterium]
MIDTKYSNTKKILIVDDSATIRKLVRKELEDAGFEVDEAENGFEALARATESTPPDLITLDIDMPGLDGFATYKKFREKHYTRFFTHVDNTRIPIIFLTANDTINAREKGFSIGASDFLTKPFCQGDLKRIVKEILYPANSLNDINALIVEDSPTSRKVVADHLLRKGVIIDEAENGIEAYKLISRDPEKYDIVITDLVMPEMDGKTLCEKIRTELNLKEMPVIFLTAISDQNKLIEVFNAGASDYIVKPFFKEELLARINVHIEMRQLTKKLKKQLKESEEKEKEKLAKEKLRTVLETAGTFCHELNQPLQNISGYTELMNMNIDKQEDLKKYISRISEEVERMGNLTKKIMKITSYSTKKYPGGYNIIDMDSIEPKE